MSQPTDQLNALDETMLNEALEELRIGARTYTKVRLRFSRRMMGNGYTLEEYESHFSCEQLPDRPPTSAIKDR